MTELVDAVETPGDAELISRVRGGDVAAYGELFSRHVEAANRLSRQLMRGPDIDDLVSEAFAKVLAVLQDGGGPDVAFRAYLLTAVRRLHVDRIRATSRVQSTDDLSPYDVGTPFQDTAVAGFESGAAAKAFASLPERWQLVLWHLEVEGQKPADIAPLLGMSANSVSALAYRAREGLRQAFLQSHLADLAGEDCRWTHDHLGGYVRKGLSRRDSQKVEQHLDECARCTAMYLELTEVNSNLAGLLAPLILGGAAAGYLGSVGGAGAGVIGVALGRAKDFVLANAQTVAAAGVAAGVATAVGVAVLVTNGGDQVNSADDSQQRVEGTADPGASAGGDAEPGTGGRGRSGGNGGDSPGPTDPGPGVPAAVPVALFPDPTPQDPAPDQSENSNNPDNPGGRSGKPRSRRQPRSR